MIERYQFIRIIEVLIAFLTSYLALLSFFSSSIYVFISKMLAWIIGELGIILQTNIDASRYMPLILSLVVLIAIAHEFTLGQEKNIINIYQINFMLFIPEALSYSKLNWFNLLDAGYILQPYRGYNQVFLTGVIIMTGYSILTFTAQYRTNMRLYYEQGLDVDQLREVITNQAILSLQLGAFTGTVIITISFIIKLLKDIAGNISVLLPYPYLILGVVASIGIIMWITTIVKSYVENA